MNQANQIATSIILSFENSKDFWLSLLPIEPKLSSYVSQDFISYLNSAIHPKQTSSSICLSSPLLDLINYKISSISLKLFYVDKLDGTYEWQIRPKDTIIFCP